MTIQLSVALVTRNRPDSLERCLKSWRDQTIQPFEIVVSDDSDDLYQPRIKELANTYNCVYTTGPRRGLYANRNHASLTCRGSHILSADDDHTHPCDYIEQILKLVKSNPRVVWIFTERHPNKPDSPLVCPAQYIRGGKIGTAKNPDECASIADGSSVYPRQIFDSGLRYDETYKFGGMWYLWGHVLKRNGWKIVFSSQTFVWHHCESDNREYDSLFLRNQIEANLYCLFIYVFWLEPSLIGFLRFMLNFFRSLILETSIYGYKVKTKLDWFNIKRLTINILTSRKKYQCMIKKNKTNPY